MSQAEAKPKPVAKVDRYWPISIAIWENANEDGKLSHSFTISRTYKEGDMYRDTLSMYATHAMELKMAIDDAWRWIKTEGRKRAFAQQQPADATTDARGAVTTSPSIATTEDDVPF